MVPLSNQLLTRRPIKKKSNIAPNPPCAPTIIPCSISLNFTLRLSPYTIKKKSDMMIGIWGTDSSPIILPLIIPSTAINITDASITFGLITLWMFNIVTLPSLS